MRKPETVFYTSVHRHLPPKLYRLKQYNPYVGGVWDFWFSGNRADLWVEYKFVVLPARDSTLVNVDLSKLQFDWGHDRLLEGRNLAVIVGCKQGGIILTDMHWAQPIACSVFKKQLLSRLEIAQWIATATGVAAKK